MIDKFKKDKPPPRSIRFTRSRYFKNPNWDKEHEENAILHTYVDRWNTPADRRARLIGKAKRQRLQDIRDRYTGGPIDYGLGLGQYYGEQIVNWLRPGQALQQLPQTGPDVIPKEAQSTNYHRSRYLYHKKPGWWQWIKNKWAEQNLHENYLTIVTDPRRNEEHFFYHQFADPYATWQDHENITRPETVKTTIKIPPQSIWK